MWRRLLLAVAVAAVLVVVLPAGAVAQRDPFDPLVDPDAATAGAGGTITTTTTTAGDAAPGPAGGGGDADGLPNTGSDATPWLVLAYALVAGGAGAVVLSRCFGAPPVSRSSGE